MTKREAWDGAITHGFLPCGIEYGVCSLSERHVVAFQIRALAGACTDPPDKLGLAHLVEATIDKGTEKHTGRELSDAFDAIGAGCGSGTGRETTTFTCTVLPEHFERAVELHAEMLRTPTFPADSVQVHLDLAQQELIALEDDGQQLADKLIGKLAYGSVLGRHPLGEAESLGHITQRDVTEYWRRSYAAGRTIVCVAGPIEPQRVLDVLQRHFDGYGSATKAGREAFPLDLTFDAQHVDKDLQQQQIAICWPGVSCVDDAYPAQQVMLGILSGGMSARLFTEIREKRGLVYWVSAWHETPRGCGMIFLGASTTPERCDLTYRTLLDEVERLAQDVTEEELRRSQIGIIAQRETRGDSTRSRCSELANDLFFFGEPRSVVEKTARIKAVTIEDIRHLLKACPRDRLCVVTLGPKALATETVVHRG